MRGYNALRGASNLFLSNPRTTWTGHDRRGRRYSPRAATTERAYSPAMGSTQAWRDILAHWREVLAELPPCPVPAAAKQNNPSPEIRKALDAARDDIAAALGETEPLARYMIRRAVRFLGEEAVREVVARAHAIDQAGGLRRRDGQRRTVGGVFFNVLRWQVSPPMWRKIEGEFGKTDSATTAPAAAKETAPAVKARTAVVVKPAAPMPVAKTAVSAVPSRLGRRRVARSPSP
jgi:hypothetical protein